MKRRLLTLFAVVAILALAMVASAQTLIYDHFVYLPLVLRPAPIPTSTPTPTPSPNPTATLPPPTNTPPPTYTPTLTPDPTRTPIPTSTPTPTSTPLPSIVHVLSNHSCYTRYDSLRIVGEVQNDTSNYLRFVKIAANIFNSWGQLVDTSYTYIHLDNLPPGEKTCFKVWFSDEPVGWTYYRFEDPSYWTDGDPLPNLALFNVSGSYDATSGDYKILGQVRNDHGAEVRFVSPVGTLYNIDNTVVDCDYTYPNDYHLDPGQTSSFKIWFSSRESYGDVFSYRLQVDGNPQ